MLALVVPTAAEPDLFYRFLRLRDSWPQQAIEIKGSKLDEEQAAQVMDLLAAHGAIAEYSEPPSRPCQETRLSPFRQVGTC